MNTEVLNALLGAAAGLLGILAAVLTLRSHISRRGIRYGKWTINLATNLYPGPLGFGGRPILEDVRFVYQGNATDKLSVTRVIFWNGSAELIEGSDIARANPVRLKSSGDVAILDARVLKVSDPGSNLRIEPIDESSVLVRFDYFEANGGGIIEVVHSGYRSDDVEVEGSIKGCGELSKPYLRDLSGISRLGFYMGSRPRLTRIATASVGAGLLYLWLFIFDELGMLFYREFHEAMRAEYAPEAIPFLYAFVILLISFVAFISLGHAWFYITRRPTRELPEFERKWGIPDE